MCAVKTLRFLRFHREVLGPSVFFDAMIIARRYSEGKMVKQQILPKIPARVRTIMYFCNEFSRETGKV